MKRTLFVCLTVVLACGLAAAGWELQSSGTKERLRGLSVVNDRVAWASGARGTVLRTVDGGLTWTTLALPDAAGLDFRDIEAFDARTAYVLAIGNGDRSRILKTIDGGVTWVEQFRNADPKAFYDDIAFWDRNNGLAVGDPIDGHYTVIRTTDGGASWTPAPPDEAPQALEGEAAFAASGSILCVQGSRNVWLATGGTHARVFRSTDRGRRWVAADAPIVSGQSAGIFSIAFADALHGVVVGGDYRKEGESSANVALTDDGGRTWKAANTMLSGFRSAVAFVPGTSGRVLVAAGPSGTDRSTDGGKTWSSLGDVGFDTIRVTPSGNVAWASGAAGRIGKLIAVR